MFSRFLVLGLVLLTCGPASTYAQTQTAIVGTLIDPSKAVLPGVTVMATESSTGRQRVAVTDERGDYRLLNLAPGTYELRAELGGFGTVVVSNIELLVGQSATIDMTMALAGLAENLTVTGEAPLIDVRSTQLAGNLDRRQMEELPILGRNWIELSMMARGVTGNAVSNDRAGGVVRDQEFQLNMDGQQIKQNVVASHHGQPRFSREAIGEFQVVTGLFDVTMGRSVGVQVQAVTRAGTNTLSGSLYGNFRHDRLNAADAITNRVLPYSNQQAGGVVGGPIRRDRIHFFTAYEYERESETVVSEPSLLPGQRFAIPRDIKNHNVLGRVDFQLSQKDHLTIRGSNWTFDNPFSEVSGTIHPTRSTHKNRHYASVLGTWAHILGDYGAQEVRLSYNYYSYADLLAVPQMADTPTYVFPGLFIGGGVQYPQDFQEAQPAIRYDLSMTRGNHDLKIGGEYLVQRDTGGYRPSRLVRGQFVFTADPPDLERRFPFDAWNDPTRWDLTGLDPLVQRFDQNFGDGSIYIPRPQSALWFSDTWSASSKLTLNLGVRWDEDRNATAPPWVIENQFVKSDIRDLNNWQPRLGFTYRLNDKNLIRGGSGRAFGTVNGSNTFGFQRSNSGREILAAFVNDGRPGFLQDPRRGVTGADILAGRVPLPKTQLEVYAPEFELPFTWQNSLGFQTQLGDVTGLDVDLIHTRHGDEIVVRDLNLFYNPDTGYNRDPRLGRPYPQYNEINWRESVGSGDDLRLSTGLTRRYSNNFQASVTYTLMFFKHDDYGDRPDNDFDLDADWARSTDFQRHTLRATGIYRLPWGGVSIAGAYFFGSGNYFQTSVGGSRPFGKTGINRLNLGKPISIPSDVADRFDGPSVIATGQMAPRNALKGLPLHKVDLRVSKEFSLGGTVKLAGTAEVFNVFNHANYGSYNGLLTSSSFGQPRHEISNSYVPRQGQVALKLSF